MSLYLSLSPACSNDALKDTLHALRLRLEPYTPQLSVLNSHALLLNLQASLPLFGGPLHLWRRIRRQLQAQPVACQLALAPTGWGAYLLARSLHPHKRCLRLNTLHRRLDTLPLSLLGPSSTQQHWLQSLGCDTFAHLRQLPRAGLSQRGLAHMLALLDQAYGTQPSVFEWLKPAEHFYDHQELDFSTRNSAVLLRVLEQQIQRLCHWLQQRQLAGDQLDIELLHDSRRMAPTVLTLQLSRSAYSLHDFLPVLHETLARQALPNPVYGCRLRLRKTYPRSVRSDSLLPDDYHTQLAQEQLLLDKLAARLGHQCLRYPQPQDSHIPEHANQWLCYQHQALNPLSQAGPGALPARPYWLLEPATELATLGHQPCIQQRPLRLIQGPERLQSGWWLKQGQEQRDYYIAQDEHHARYWVYRLVKQADRWFLHGVFA